MQRMQPPLPKTHWQSARDNFTIDRTKNLLLLLVAGSSLYMKKHRAAKGGS
jgi:hypothetical protein